MAAMYCDGLPEEKIEQITLENIRISFKEGECEKGVPIMSEGVEECSRKGIFIRNVKELSVKNVLVEGNDGEPIITEGVDHITK